MNDKIRVIIGDTILEGKPDNLKRAIFETHIPRIKGVLGMAVTDTEGNILSANVTDQEGLSDTLNEIKGFLESIEDGTISVEEILKEEKP